MINEKKENEKKEQLKNEKKEQLKKYFGWTEPGEIIPVNSIIFQIIQMFNNHFIFCTFNESSKERNDSNDLFSSNRYLWKILTNHYFIDQSLHIRRLTDKKKGKYKSASLMHFLEYAKGLGVDAKGLGLDDTEIEILKEKLKSAEIKKYRNFVDQHVAHADLDAPKVLLTMEEIKKCHDSIKEVFKKIGLEFFDTDMSYCLKTKLTKKQILKNADKPFLAQ